MRQFIGILLIAFAVYTPVSIFVNIPPFDTDKVLYTYYVSVDKPENDISNIPNLIYPTPSKGKELVRTSIPVQDPAYYNLIYDYSEYDTTGNSWWLPSIFIMVGCFIFGVIALAGKSEH